MASGKQHGTPDRPAQVVLAAVRVAITTTIRSYCDGESAAGMKRFEQTMLARVARLGKPARPKRGRQAGGR